LLEVIVESPLLVILTFDVVSVSLVSIDDLDVRCQYALVPREAIATPERILHAAYERFSRYGFRRTSMADIAAEAGVSRAALYLQFRNKEEIFRSLAKDLHDEALAGAATALDADGSLGERLIAAFEAKSLRFVAIALGSPHGDELLDETNRLCGDLVGDMERRFLELLTRVLRRAAQHGEVDLAPLGLAAADAAGLLVRSARGLKAPGVTVEDYRRSLHALVRVFVAGLQRRSAGARRKSARARG
jgi:AcrR family transcriptional regulator